MIKMIRIRNYLGFEGQGWLARLLATVMLLIFLALFWRMIISFQFIRSDEWTVFAGYASSNDAGDLVRETLSPHNNHFTPLHKLLVLVMYSVFSTNPVPYNIMSILLLAIALVLFYSFTSEAIEDRAAAALTTFAMGTTSAYYGIMFWPFTHGHLLSLIFLLLSLMYTHKGLMQSKVRYFIFASVSSLISALFFTTGLLAAPLAAFYMVARSFPVRPGDLKAIALKAAILMAPMLLYIPIYLSLSMESLSVSNTSLPLFQVMKITLVIMGSLSIMEFSPIPMSLATAIGKFVELDSADVAATDAAIAMLCLAVFCFVALLIVLLYAKTSKKLRSMVLFGFVFTALYAGLHAAGKGNYYSGGLNQLLSISRYSLFPSAGLFMIMAASVSHFNKYYGKRGLYVAAALVLLLAVFHQSFLIKASSIIQKGGSEKYVEMSLIALRMKNPDSMTMLLKPGSADLWKYYSIYKSKDDAVIASPRMMYILRSHLDVKPEDIVVARGRAVVEEGGVNVVEAPAELVISSPQPNYIQHLVFMLKSSGDAHLEFICKSGNTLVLVNKLKTESRLYFKYHALVCPSGNKLILKFDRGTHKIRGIRLYK